MLDFSWGHIFIVLIVALVVVGPKDLPRLMRTVGQWAGKARQMAGQLRKGFDDLARESELDELRKEIGNLRSERPLAGLNRDLDKSIAQDGMKSKPAVAMKTETAQREVTAAPEPASAYKFPPP